MLANDPISRVLYIDLARRKSWVADRTDLFEAALGGVSAGIRLLNEECPPGADPLDPRTNHPDGGFRCWLFPLASRRWRFQIASHRATGREPRRGRSAVAIRMAGYGAIVIRGEAACRSTCKDGTTSISGRLRAVGCTAASPPGRCCASVKKVLGSAPSCALVARASAWSPTPA